MYTSTGRRARVRAALALLVAVTGLIAVSACSPAPAAEAHGQQPAAMESPSARYIAPTQVRAASLRISPNPALPMNPRTPVTVDVTDGRLTRVSLTNASGYQVAGTSSVDHMGWHSTEPLGYGKHYTLTVQVVGTDGHSSMRITTLTTLQPQLLTMPYLQRAGGYALTDGATYGVGIVPVVHFDEHITDRAAAEAALHVTTSPATPGAWYWPDDQDAHWRPRNFYSPGTTVSVSAMVYGARLGDGLYGQSDVSASFTIGARQIAIADDTTHQVQVYRNGVLQRTMPTSMGQHRSVPGTNGPVSFFTMQGTYTVLEHDNPAIMSSASYGLPADAPGGYGPEPIYWATKISTDGIYLHELDSTVGYQGHTDVSHGCLNLNQDNASWYFTHSLVGDVVEVTHTGGPTITVAEGGDWSVPWSTWVRG